jgi:RND family efflux transporter MFP subunit
MMTRRSQARVALVLVAAAAGCDSRTHADLPPARPVRVQAARSELATMGLRYSATIQPYEQVSLAFKAGGYVRELRQVAGQDGRPRSLQQGDTVARGTVLARLHTNDYQERVNQARAQMAEADAGLIKAKADAARAETLYAAQALTRPDYDSAVASLAAATARLEAARAAWQATQIGLEDTTLVSPTDGVVLSRQMEVGTLAGVGAPAFTVADLTRVKAVFGVPDLVVGRVQIGTALRLTSDAFGPEEFPGRVTAVSPSADAQSRVFNVEVTIPNADRRLKPGMIASVEVAPQGIDIPAGSTTVPVSAVVKSPKGGEYAVFVVQGSGEKLNAQSREVSLGRISGNRVAVASGLEPGERVVVSGASLLGDGDRVRLIPGGEGE